MVKNLLAFIKLKASTPEHYQFDLLPYISFIYLKGMMLFQIVSGVNRNKYKCIHRTTIGSHKAWKIYWGHPGGRGSSGSFI